jgi:hypothetical protein
VGLLPAPAGEFEAAYLARLQRYGPQRLGRALTRIAREAYLEPSSRLVLCCCKADPAQCHRLQFADWLLVTTGERCMEID